jgi:alkylhydroperoxidase family enzyme
LRISLMNGCDYCSQHHVASSKKTNLGPQDWSALKKGDFSRFPEKDQVALRYASKITKAPESADDSDFAELKKHFSDPEIMDLHMLIGLTNLTNRVTGPLALDLEFPREEVK